MIEAVSTSSVLTTALKASSQSGAAASPAQTASAPKLGTTRIFVNNLQNVAVLQHLASDGTVTAQYPTQAQIRAFHEAEALAAEHAQVEKLTSPHSDGGPTSQANAPAQSSEPAPSVSNILEAMTTASYTPGNTSAPAQSQSQSSDSQSSTSVVV